MTAFETPVALPAEEAGFGNKGSSRQVRLTRLFAAPLATYTIDVAFS